MTQKDKLLTLDFCEKDAYSTRIRRSYGRYVSCKESA